MTRDLIIDADHVAFNVSESKTYKTGFEHASNYEEYEDLELEASEIDFTQYTNHFKSIIDMYIMIGECAGVAYGWDIGEVKIIMSDTTNFRYALYPEYKNKRLEGSEIGTKLRQWARQEYICEKCIEADDVVSYYVRNGGVGVTTDKDLLKGVEGIWYNAHYMHKSWGITSKESAEYFFKCQLLAGDGVDNIPSLPKVGLITADKLMKKYGSSYKDIERIFKDRGFNKDYMLTMGRLVNMKQWIPKRGIRLWNV